VPYLSASAVIFLHQRTLYQAYDLYFYLKQSNRRTERQVRRALCFAADFDGMFTEKAIKVECACACASARAHLLWGSLVGTFVGSSEGALGTLLIPRSGAVYPRLVGTLDYYHEQTDTQTES